MNVKPALHGRDHSPGGADPIVGWGGGIDFNKTNITDSAGNDADFLEVRTIGTGTGGESGYAISFINAAAAGGIHFQNDTDGGYYVNDNGALGITLHATAGAGTNAVTGAENGINLHCTAGVTYISNYDDGMIIDAIGSDGSNVALLIKIGGGEYLKITNLPTSNPGGTGLVWKNGNVLNIT